MQRVAVMVIFFLFAILTGPFLVINIFSPIYAAAAEEKISEKCLYIPATEISTHDISAKVKLVKCKHLFVWSADREELRRTVSDLEIILPGLKIEPDFAASSERDWCHNLSSQKLQDSSAFGAKTSLVKLSYACEAKGVNLDSFALANVGLAKQYQHGMEFVGLIWAVNLQP